MNQITICKAPLRISLAGGGTDTQSYCSKYGGEVIGFAIDRYVISTYYPFRIDGNKSYLSDDALKMSDNQGLFDDYTKLALQSAGLNNIESFQLNTISDVPAGVGLGGSAAYLNSVISVLKYAQGSLNDAQYIADLSSNIEIQKLCRNVGKQDHYLSAYGGLNHLEFDKSLNASVTSIQVGDNCKQYFNENLLLFYTGISRSASEVLSDQIVTNNSPADSPKRKLDCIRALVKPMRECIESDDPSRIGELLLEHWKIKSTLSKKVSNKKMDEVISVALRNGSDGCKVLGAGGGGFLLISTKNGMQSEVRNVFSNYGYTELPFNFNPKGLLVNSM